MKTTELGPQQIITLNDFPLHSKKRFAKYLRKCEHGERLPYVPVLRKNAVKKYLDDRLLGILEVFQKDNQEAEYFMIDGSHRTTALTLSRCRIPVVLYENDADIVEAKEALPTGQVLDNGTLYLTFEENCEVLNKHFLEKPYFMTVEQKSRKIEDYLAKNLRGK